MLSIPYRELIHIVLLDSHIFKRKFVYDFKTMLNVELNNRKGTMTSSFLQNLMLKIGFWIPSPLTNLNFRSKD